MNAASPRAGRPRRQLRWRALLVVPLAALAPTNARAEEPSACGSIRARAASDASLLFAPQLQLQGLRFPLGGAYDDTTFGRTGVQLRVGLAWSPLDAYRGVKTLRLGAAQCEAKVAADRASTALRLAPSRGALAARRKQAAFLEAQHSTWGAHVAASEERLRAGVITLAQLREVRGRAAALDRARIRVDAEVAALERQAPRTPSVPLDQATRDVERTTARVASEAGGLRTLDALKLSVSGGVVPQDGPLDYYGMVLVGLSTGALFRSAYEGDAARAARLEAGSDPGSVQREGARIERDHAVRAEAARREAAILSREIDRLLASRASLEAGAPPGAPHALTLVDLERIALEAERIYTATLAVELARPDGESQ